MKKAFLGLGTAVVVLAAVVVGRAATLHSKQIAVPPRADVALDAAAATKAAEHLAAAVRFKTLSNFDPKNVDVAAFEGFVTWLETTYPLAHATLSRERAGPGGRGLLYEWKGSDPAARPVLLISHYDVVPVEPGTEANWTQPPFDGVIADGFVWGRGAVDDKQGVVGVFEAIEILLAKGHAPKRSIHLAFGSDEEVGGQDAKAAAALYAQRGVKFEMSLDEGLPISVGIIPDLPKPVALVGMAEKGYLSVELIAAGPGGHSSVPPPETAVSILAAAITALASHPMPANLDGPAATLFQWTGPEMPFAKRIPLANLWLFGPLVEATMSKKAPTNALIRTTTAPTMLSGSVKDNVLPQKATAVVNFRILPGETIALVLARVKEIIGDERVTLRPFEHTMAEPSKRASTDSASFRLLHRTIAETQPDVLVAPGIVLGATDSRHYRDVVDDSFRFRPVRSGPEDVKRVHGTDERLSVENFAACIGFYGQLLVNLDAPAGAPTAP